MLTNFAGLRAVLAILLAGLSTSCVVPDISLPEYTDTGPGNQSMMTEPDFNWHLSGDRRVAPRQVFSDRGRIWLQWHPHQAVPAVFVEQSHGWQVLDQHQQGQYTVIDGHWRRLRFQGGQLQASAVYRPTIVDRACDKSCPATGAKFQLRLADSTIRQALRRWSEQANWFFDDAHWTLAVDLPVTAPADFDGGYESAVTQLLRSVRSAGESVKPCFYANHVLRVISAAQSCDPMTTTGDRP